MKNGRPTSPRTSGGKSYGNLRAMHGQVAAGKVTAIGFNDEARQIEIVAKVVDDGEWAKVTEGVYTGFSQGGRYARRWTDEAGATRYTAEPHEISLVDLPCLAEARSRWSRPTARGNGCRSNPILSSPTSPRSARATARRTRRASRTCTTRPWRSAPPATPSRCPRRTTTWRKRWATTWPGSVRRWRSSTARWRAASRRSESGWPRAWRDAFAGVDARLKRIEDQPLPLPYAAGSRPVAKNEDGLDAALDTMLADPATLSLLAIKLAQSRAR